MYVNTLSIVPQKHSKLQENNYLKITATISKNGIKQ